MKFEKRNPSFLDCKVNKLVKRRFQDNFEFFQFVKNKIKFQRINEIKIHATIYKSYSLFLDCSSRQIGERTFPG